jgi:hypothetical protein
MRLLYRMRSAGLGFACANSLSICFGAPTREVIRFDTRIRLCGGEAVTTGNLNSKGLKVPNFCLVTEKWAILATNF